MIHHSKEEEGEDKNKDEPECIAVHKQQSCITIDILRRTL
jgi:hypothetical protein